MTKSNLLCLAAGFVGGLAVGTIINYIYNKKKENTFEDDFDEEFLDDRYVRHIDEFDDEGVEINPPLTREDGVLTREAREAIKEKLVANYEGTSRYAQMYKDAVSEHPVDSDEDEDIETPEEIADAEHKANFNKPPELISAEEFSNLPAYIETAALYFYFYDSVLVDEEDDEIDDPGVLVGDVLDSSGFSEDNTEDIIFVMNYQLDKAFEIHKVMGSWMSEPISDE